MTDGLHMDFKMSLLCFWALNVVVSLLSMEGQKALGFHRTYPNLCSEDHKNRNDRICIFVWTNPLISWSRCIGLELHFAALQEQYGTPLD